MVVPCNRVEAWGDVEKYSGLIYRFLLRKRDD